jgi:hypothetical protein
MATDSSDYAGPIGCTPKHLSHGSAQGFSMNLVKDMTRFEDSSFIKAAGLSGEAGQSRCHSLHLSEMQAHL